MALFQMFSSPSPQRIVYELRFGLFSDLCLVHLDRFGRRTLYSIHIETIHYDADIMDAALFNAADLDGLTHFVDDDPRRSLSTEHPIEHSVDHTVDRNGDPSTTGADGDGLDSYPINVNQGMYSVHYPFSNWFFSVISLFKNDQNVT